MSERQSARMSEIKNGRLGLHGAEHSKCNHMMTLGFKGLNSLSSVAKTFTDDAWFLWSGILGLSDTE